MLPILLVVHHYSQSILILIQCVASNDTQMVQRQAAELINCEQDVARHLPDRLSDENTRKRNERQHTNLQFFLQ